MDLDLVETVNSSGLFVALLVIAGLLSGVVLVAPPAAAASTTTWTSTADFDAGTKQEPMVARNWFATNGVSQPGNWIVYPMAAFFNGRTYVVWQGPNSAGAATVPSPYIAYYDHAASAWSSPVRIADGPLTSDDHGAPSILVDASGYIHVFYGAHAKPVRYSRSTNFEDISSWTTHTPLYDLLTYTKPILVGSTIYLVVRESNAGDTASWQDYITSTDGGATWSARVQIINFAGLTGIYAGPMALWADQIHMTWSDATRQHAYEAYLNTTDGKMYCKGSPDVDLGALIDQAEATASCLLESTPGSARSDFGAVKLDSSGNPYVIYRRRWNAANTWAHRFTYWSAGAWVAPANVTGAKAQGNYADFTVTSSTVITAYLTTSGLVATGRGGDVEMWGWAAGAWTKTSTVLSEKLTHFTLNNAALVFGYPGSGPQVIFTETYVDVYNLDISGSLKVYAYDGSAFVTNQEALGTYAVESNTDCSAVAAGSLELASGRCDPFTVAKADSNTFRWHVGRYLSGSDVGNARTDIATYTAGKLYLRFSSGSGATDAWGVISEATLTGDFDVSVSPTRIGTVSGVRFFLGILNEDTISGESSSSVDGVIYEQFWQTGVGGDRRFIAYSVTNGVLTVVGGSTQFTAGNSFDRNVRIARVGNQVTWYYNATGAQTWTQDETVSFTFSGNSHSVLYTNANALRTPEWNADGFAFTGTFAAGGYRTSGSWTSPAQTTGGEYPHRISIVASSLSATTYVDGIDILDAAGNIVYSDATNFNAGTTMDYIIPYSETIANAWSVRVNLAGDGNGTPVVESISVTTDPNPVTSGVGKRGVHVSCRITWPVQNLECIGWVDQWWKDLAGGLKESWFVVNGRIVLQNGTLRVPVADSWYIPEIVSYEVVFVARSHFGISAPSLPETVTLEKRSLGFAPVFLTLLAMFAVVRFSVIKQHGKPEDAK